MKETTPKFLKLPQLAPLVGMGYHQLRHATIAGLIPFYKFGKARFFKLDEVEAAILAHRVGTKTEVLS